LPRAAAPCACSCCHALHAPCRCFLLSSPFAWRLWNASPAGHIVQAGKVPCHQSSIACGQTTRSTMRFNKCADLGTGILSRCHTAIFGLWWYNHGSFWLFSRQSLLGSRCSVPIDKPLYKTADAPLGISLRLLCAHSISDRTKPPTQKEHCDCRQQGDTEWAVTSRTPALDHVWAALKPQLAHRFPFELDVFQKEAIIHLEQVSIATLSCPANLVYRVTNEIVWAASGLLHLNTPPVGPGAGPPPPTQPTPTHTHTHTHMHTQIDDVIVRCVNVVCFLCVSGATSLQAYLVISK
jgi:hypothetical protein